jgi:PAS domain S-box-containing protein
MMGREGEPEARFRAMADSVPVLVWTTDVAGGATFVNQRWLDFTGRALDQELGDGWIEDLHPADVDPCLHAFREAFGRREQFEMEYRLRRADGEWRWVLVRGVPVYGDGGGFEGYIGSCLDITERREAEEALRASREDLAAAMAAGRMGSFDWDLVTGRVTRDANLESLYGLGPGEAASFEEWSVLVHPDDRRALLAEVDRVVATGGRYRLTHRLVRPDGDVRWLERRGEGFADESGRVVRIRGMVIDVTDRELAAHERDVLLERVSRLQAVTAALSKSGTTDEVLEAMVTAGIDAMGASAGSIALLSHPASGLRVARAAGYPAELVERYSWVPLEASIPLTDAVRAGTPVVCRDRGDWARQYPELAAAQTATGHQAVAAFPLVVEDRVLGGMGLSFTSPQDFDPAQVAFLQAVAAQCAQAVDRARSYEAVSRAHEEAERSAAQLRFLLDVSTILSSPLAPEERLEELATQSAGALCDICFIDVVDADGTLRRVATARAHPEPAPLASAHRDRFRLREGSGLPGVVGVIRTGQAELCPDVTDDWLAAVTSDAFHFDVAKKLGALSYIAAPLVGRRRVLGAITLVTTPRSGRRYNLGDLALVEDMANRVALAMDSARLQDEMRRVAQTLQASLLPAVPPAIPGLDVGSRYVAAGEGTIVGGDFYDVFATGPGSWATVVGDVCGQGVEAATVTGVARHTVRSAALEHTSPAAVLAHLNEVLLAVQADAAAEGDPRFATVCLARVELTPDGASVTISLAGHPRPFLVSTNGDVTPVGPPGTLLGVVPDPHLTDDECLLHPGESLVLYTDGVTERRAGGRYFGEDGLAEVLAASAFAPADVVAGRVQEAVGTFAAEPPSDDMAVVVVRVPPVTPAGTS